MSMTILESCTQVKCMAVETVFHGAAVKGHYRDVTRGFDIRSARSWTQVDVYLLSPTTRMNSTLCHNSVINPYYLRLPKSPVYNVVLHTVVGLPYNIQSNR